MELTTGSCLCHSQLPLAAQTLGTQLPGASVCLPWARVILPGLALPHPPHNSLHPGGACEPTTCWPCWAVWEVIADHSVQPQLRLNRLRPREGRDLLWVSLGPSSAVMLPYYCLYVPSLLGHCVPLLPVVCTHHNTRCTH